MSALTRAPWLVAALSGGLLVLPAPLPRFRAPVDLGGFASLPVLHEGRIKPLDTVARNSLLVLSGRQTFRPGGREAAAVEWLLDVLARPEAADVYRVFRIDEPEALGLIGRGPEDGRVYSFMDLRPALGEIRRLAERAQGVEPPARSRFESAVVRLNERLMLYQGLKNTLQAEETKDLPAEVDQYMRALPAGIAAVAAHHKSSRFDRRALERLNSFFERYQFLDQAASFRALPPVQGGDPAGWTSVGGGLLEALKTGAPREGALAYGRLLRAWRRGDAADFNAAVEERRARFKGTAPGTLAAAGREAAFNRAEPFYRGMILYLAVLLLGFASWTAWPERLSRAAYWTLLLAFAVHTAGLAARVLLQGRPPVTNLYSSAVFVGWAAVLGAILIERRTRKGFGSVVAGAIGFSTLLVAHHLSGEGDTMEMMRAVLDSNFWLATHVVTITVGYGATFLAGMLAHVYILRRLAGPSLDRESERLLARSVYGVVCFGLFFSFVGTVLGGIWADQSWGRFWGWDPKENGALLIVLWNAIILHARWGGYIKERGLMVMAVFGNIVTSLSWFGVNMLGIGLHSYGFMDKAFVWLAVFILSQSAVMALAGRLNSREA